MKKTNFLFSIILVLIFSIQGNAEIQKNSDTYIIVNNPNGVSIDFIEDLPSQQLDFIRLYDERTQITFRGTNITIELLSAKELKAKGITVSDNHVAKGSLWTSNPDYKKIKRNFDVIDGMLIDKSDYLNKK